MGKKTLNPSNMPIPRGSCSQVAIAGNFVFIAGNTATDFDGNVVGIGDIRAQTRQALDKVKRAVEAAGGTLDDIVSMTIFVTDARYYSAVNEVRGEVMGSNFPTSTMVQIVALAWPELLIEMNAVAVLPDSSQRKN